MIGQRMVDYLGTLRWDVYRPYFKGTHGTAIHVLRPPPTHADCFICMSTFGGTAIHQFLTDGYTGVSQRGRMRSRFSKCFIAVDALVLLIIFFVTSSDSGSLVVDTITAGGKFDAPVEAFAETNPDLDLAEWDPSHGTNSCFASSSYPC